MFVFLYVSTSTSFKFNINSHLWWHIPVRRVRASVHLWDHWWMQSQLERSYWLTRTLQQARTHNTQSARRPHMHVWSESLCWWCRPCASLHWNRLGLYTIQCNTMPTYYPVPYFVWITAAHSIMARPKTTESSSSNSDTMMVLMQTQNQSNVYDFYRIGL